MTSFDVIVMGGGPAGAVCAIELARRQRRVALLDTDFTPKYRVGESLSPTACEVLESVGVNLGEAGFVAKGGTTFAWGERGVFRIRYAAARAWQVRRAELDTSLLRLAEKAGVHVRGGNRVDRVRFVGQTAVGVRARTSEGLVCDLDAPWVVDGTGRRALLARQLHLLDSRCSRSDHHLLWSYWRNGHRLPGDAAGDALFVGGGGQAWWYLPVDDRNDMISAGVLAPGRPEVPVREAYLDRVARSDRISRLLATAHHIGPVRTAPARSQVSSRLVGQGWLLVGDAAGFVDPILTPGAQLAVQSGQSAAAVVDAALRGDSGAARALHGYERRLHRELSTYRWLADNFYASAQADCAADLPLAAGDERGDRLTFLSVIGGVPPYHLTALIDQYRAMRGAAAGYGGVPPGFDETGSFAFLSWLARSGNPMPKRPRATGEVIHLTSGTHVEDIYPPDEAPGPVRRAVRTAAGDEYLLTWELETLLRVLSTDGTRAELVHRFATASGAAPDPAAFDGWLDLLLQHGLLERVPEPARVDAGAMKAGS